LVLVSRLAYHFRRLPLHPRRVVLKKSNPIKVTKRAAHGVLVEGIREVAAGRRFLSPEAASALAQSVMKSAADDGIGKLSEHERKVYQLLGQGVDTFDIAAALHISNHTVESYYARMIVKLNLNGMRELRRHAINRCQKHAQ
jgi:DNA-binding NarL/FixJ family response regulator